VTFALDANDGRKPIGHLPEIDFGELKNPVVQVIEQATGDIVSTVRVRGPRYRPPVFAAGKYTVKFGRDKPDGAIRVDLEPA
jgi:hypothetical protein